MKDIRKIIAAVTAFTVITGAVAACTNSSASEQTEETSETTTSEQTTEAPSEETGEETDGSAETEPAETEPITTVVTVDNSFTFTRSNFPTLDGSTSMVPMGEAIVSVLLGVTREEASDLLPDFHKTSRSFQYLMDGSSDLLICAQPSDEVFATMEEEGFEYEMAPFATEALVFVVNANNPVESLTADQIRGIYTGEITNWSQVGGNDSEIIPIQRNPEAGSQVMMESLVMDGQEMMEAPTTYVVGDMEGLIEVVRSYDNSADAIGYSVYYYAANMNMADGLKIIAVDGVQPEPATIADGSYPFRNPYFVVINAHEEEDSPARILYNWILSEEGQSLVDAEGYVPVGAASSGN